MVRHLKFLAGLTAIFGLLILNLHVARAHNWSNYHWDKSGSRIVIQTQNTATQWQAAENARLDMWNKIWILYNYSVNYHTDISVFDGNYGATGWIGLASIESTAWDWGSWSWSHITHGHARYNAYYPASQGYIQGVFCQEIFHTYGFDHSNTGDCMGLGYYNSDKFNLSQHNVDDFYNRYRNH
jgi:predicted Zn-dependent protease